jgi:hypothetical protein
MENTSSQASPPPPVRRGNPVRTAVSVVLLLGIAVALFFAIQRARGISQYNRVQETLMAQGKYAEAAAELEGVRRWVWWGEEGKQVREDLARAYLMQADDPSKPMSEAIVFVQKANEIAPQTLSEMHKKMLQLGPNATRRNVLPERPPEPAAAMPVESSHDHAGHSHDDGHDHGTATKPATMPAE